MKKLSAKFHLALGLTSIVMTLLLSATMLNLIPDRQKAVISGRVALAESVASSSTLFLSKKDHSSIQSNLEFIINRNEDLLAATVVRGGDEIPLVIGDETAIDPEYDTSTSTTSTLVLPILQGEAEWGKIALFFTNPDGNGWLKKLQNSRLALIAFCSLLGFLLFYLYLGKMLKALNPSQAVPGRVRSALDTLAEALIVVDRKSNVVLANKAFQTITGESAEALLGKKADEFEWHLSEEHPLEQSETAEGEPQEEKIFPWMEALNTSETVRGADVWLEAHDGNWHKFLVNCSPILSGKKASGVLVSLDDVTDLEEKEKELRSARDAAQDANRAKSDFLSNMSHEIRTPMTAILGFTEVLKRGNGASDSDWEKHLGTISSSGKHLLELINDVLDLSKVESGALEVETIDCKPHVVAHDVVQVLRVRAEDKDIGLDIEIPEPLPEVIQTDAGRLRQIITNLVGNAIKFTEDGGVKVILRTYEEEGKEKFAIDVKDSGIGMNEQQQAAVFKPFVQADSSITRRFGGTGLGLAISRKLARAMGGDILLSSEADVGTTFTAVIDLVTDGDVKILQPEELFAQVEIAEAEAHASWEFPECNVLVIDDAAENRELLTLVLNDLGISTETAENGAIGVDMATSSTYDVILSDIQMPVMDGYQAVAAMREKGLSQPIIALTANAMKGYEERILKAGFSHYMTKPIDIDALSKLLAELIGGKKVDKPKESAAAPAKAPITKEAANQQEDDQELYYSRLAGSEKLAPVVEKFITRVREQFTQMENANNGSDFTELAALAHWLKGSGGTVGFDQLSKPAKQLEDNAKAGDQTACKSDLVRIKSIIERLRAGTSTDTQPAESTPVETQDSELQAVDVVESTLLAKNPSFRPIVAKFLPRLESQLVAMDEAVEQQDFEELAALAHWLKGSGGTVGFDIFTKPAAKMEVGAKENDMDTVRKRLLEIKDYASKIVVPGNDESPDVEQSA